MQPLLSHYTSVEREWWVETSPSCPHDIIRGHVVMSWWEKHTTVKINLKKTGKASHLDATDVFLTVSGQLTQISSNAGVCVCVCFKGCFFRSRGLRSKLCFYGMIHCFHTDICLWGHHRFCFPSLQLPSMRSSRYVVPATTTPQNHYYRNFTSISDRFNICFVLL